MSIQVRTQSKTNCFLFINSDFLICQKIPLVSSTKVHPYTTSGISKKFKWFTLSRFTYKHIGVVSQVLMNEWNNCVCNILKFHVGGGGGQTRSNIYIRRGYLISVHVRMRGSR